MRDEIIIFAMKQREHAIQLQYIITEKIYHLCLLEEQKEREIELLVWNRISKK